MNFIREKLVSLQRKAVHQSKLGTAGFTLIEAMILAAMIAVIVTAFSSYTFQRARQIEAQNKKKSYQQIQNQIKAAAGQAESLVQTEEMQWDATLPTPTGTP